MTALYRTLLIALLATLGTQASADPRPAGRYEMVSLSPGQSQATAKVLILDKQTGALWTWTESSAAVYSGKIFPITADGAFVRIIHVNPGKDGQ